MEGVKFPHIDHNGISMNQDQGCQSYFIDYTNLNHAYHNRCVQTAAQVWCHLMYIFIAVRAERLSHNLLRTEQELIYGCFASAKSDPVHGDIGDNFFQLAGLHQRISFYNFVLIEQTKNILSLKINLSLYCLVFKSCGNF